MIFEVQNLWVNNNKSRVVWGEIAKSLIWVAGAVSRDDLKPALMLLKVEEKRVVATDGHKLHLWDGSFNELSPGLYCVPRRTTRRLEIYKYDGPELSGLGGTYPDIDKPHLLPTYDLKKQTVEGCSKSVSLYDTSIYARYAQVIRAMDPTVTINFDKFKGTAEGMDRVFVRDDSIRGLVFMGKQRIGLLMPVRVGDDW